MTRLTGGAIFGHKVVIRHHKSQAKYPKKLNYHKLQSHLETLYWPEVVDVEIHVVGAAAILDFCTT